MSGRGPINFCSSITALKEDCISALVGWNGLYGTCKGQLFSKVDFDRFLLEIVGARERATENRGLRIEGSCP